MLGAVDWLRGQGYPAGRIGGLGVSLGSSACLGAAADEPAIGATVSDSGFAMIEPVIRANWRAESHLPDFVLPGVTAVGRLMYGYDLQSSRSVEDAARISGGLLIIHGEQDSLVPPEHARLLSAAAPLAEVWMVAGAVHAGCYGVDPAAYTARVVSFFERWLT